MTNSKSIMYSNCYFINFSIPNEHVKILTKILIFDTLTAIMGIST